MLSVLLAIPTAVAHLPHDVVTVSATPRDLEADLPWYGAAAPINTVLGRSDDQGNTWTLIGGAPTVDELLGGTVLDDGTVALLAEGGWWWLGPDSTEWTKVEMPNARGIAGTDRLFVHDGSVLFTGHPATGMDASTPFNGLRHLTRSKTDVAAVDDDGQVWIERSGSWQSLGSPAVDTSSVAASGNEVYAGTRSGDVYRYWGKVWNLCGELPVPDEGQSWEPDVVQLALTDGAVLAAPAWEAPMVSYDYCATWVADRTAPTLDTVYVGNGAAESPDESFSGLDADGDLWVLGGWGGLSVTRDGGESWSEAPLVPPDYTRDLALSPNFDADGTLFIGGYAAGVHVSHDGGETLEAPSGGLELPNVQGVEIPRWATSSDFVLGIVNHVLWLSEDGGQSWDRAGTPYQTDSFVTTMWPDRIWVVAGQNDGVLTEWNIAESTDGGATWSGMDLFAPVFGNHVPGAFKQVPVDGDYWLCALDSDPVQLACSEDEETWDLLIDTDVEDREKGSRASSHDLTWWPADNAEHLIALEYGRAHLSTDRGATWTEPEWPDEADGPVLVTVTDDDSIFATSAAGRILRSLDGGLSFEDLGFVVPAATKTLHAREGFATHPDLLLASIDGVYVVQDANTDSPVFGPFDGFMRIDVVSEYLSREGCGDVERGIANFGMSTRLTIVEGCSVAVYLEGDRITLRGEAEGSSQVSLSLDGVEVAELGDSEDTDGILWETDGLEDTWHRVVLTGLAGSDLHLDAAESYGAALLFGEAYEPPDTGSDTAIDSSPPVDSGGTQGGTDSGPADPEDPDDGRCGGCAGGPAGWWVAALPFLFARRRRSWSCSTTSRV